MFVVDASVIVEYLIEGAYTSHAKNLFVHADKSDNFIVPEFCLLECTNVLWKHIRFNGMALVTAQRLLKHMKKLPLRRVPVKSLLNSALAIGSTHQLAIYDSAYVAIAKKSESPLISLDQKQIQTALAEGIQVIPITNF
jgi:predicted nucleic acid-binding protein